MVKITKSDFLKNAPAFFARENPARLSIPIPLDVDSPPIEITRSCEAVTWTRSQLLFILGMAAILGAYVASKGELY